MSTYYEEHNLKPQDNLPSQSNDPFSITIQDFLAPESEAPNNAYAELANTYINIIRNNADSSDVNQLVLLDNLVAQLIEESSQNVKGPPPASKAFIEGLKNVDPSTIKDDTRCSICKEDLKREESHDVVKLPCSHHFDKDCVLPWLKLHNTCPICRSEVPSDDKDWIKEHEALKPYEDYDPDYMYS